LREIHNPDLESRNPRGNGDIRSLPVVLVLVFVLFFGFQFVRQVKQPLPIPAGQVQPTTVHKEIDKAPSPLAGGRSIASASNFGWLTFIAKPLYLALRFLHDHGIGNWGWSIIVLTVIFNLLIIWPRMMSMKSF
jgi:membrane protein insertase Oxa1/YidC/SpoIIIJ